MRFFSAIFATVSVPSGRRTGGSALSARTSNALASFRGSPGCWWFALAISVLIWPTLIGQIPNYVAAPLIREGRLVHLLAKHSSERIGLYIYYPQRAHLPARTRRFIDFAVARLQAAGRSV